MPITALPTPPSRQDPANFASRGDALMAALHTFVEEANAVAAAMNLNSTTDASVSSVAIGVGTKVFTVSAGKSFQPGMYLIFADAAAPSTNSMLGQVTSYVGTTLTVFVKSLSGSGTKSDWVISQSAPGGASLDISGNVVEPANTANAAAGATQFSHRNKIINGDFRVNNRVYVSGAAVGAGLYAHDRWKMAASADTYTFSTTANKTTVTIPAGKVLRQVVEGLNLQAGTYVLSWEGTAQGKIGAGALAASGVTGAITGGVDTTIEFGPGTVANVQLEIGSVATPFEHRPLQVEQALCGRYCKKGRAYLLAYALAGAGFAYRVGFDTPMMASPTITYSGTAYLNASLLVNSEVDVNGFVPSATATAAGAARFASDFLAVSEL